VNAGDVEQFDVVVIGSGPAGQKAAIQAAKAGKTVAVFGFPTMAEAYRIAALDIVKQRGRVSSSETVADVLSALL